MTQDQLQQGPRRPKRACAPAWLGRGRPTTWPRSPAKNWEGLPWPLWLYELPSPHPHGCGQACGTTAAPEWARAAAAYGSAPAAAVARGVDSLEATWCWAFPGAMALDVASGLPLPA